MAQELASIDQDTLLLVFLDLQKSYNTLYCRRILPILEEYGATPKIRGLLGEFWENQ